jgi:hypothetical protein
MPEAVEGDQEVRHQLVVAGLLRQLEQALHEDLVELQAAALVHVAQERAAHGRSGVGQPGLREAGQPVGGVEGAHRLDDAFVARREERVHLRRRARVDHGRGL